MEYKSYEVHKEIFCVPSKYSPVGLIGRGAYGNVCAFRNTQTGDGVAIKKITGVFNDGSSNDGNSSSAIAERTLREIMLLRHIHHDNIVSLIDVIVPLSFHQLEDVYVALELMDTDLHRLLQATPGQRLNDDYCRYFVYQLLRGLKYLHSAGILHRDLKPSNVLVNCSSCALKICDFGLATQLSNPNPDSNSGGEEQLLTEYVVTRPYRAPELLLGSRSYDGAVDIWSAGCILMEMLTGQPLFPYEDSHRHPVHHLNLITQLLGSPQLEELSYLRDDTVRAHVHASLSGRSIVPLSDRWPDVNSEALDLVGKMLKLDPSKRLNAEEALAHPYLATLHEVDDEPTCNATFDFFPHGGLSVEHIKYLIWSEACAFNPLRYEKKVL